MDKKEDDQTVQLGDLEADVMSVVWDLRQATVQDVQQALEPRRPLAYTTVMTVMSRLADKGLLERRKEGRAYLYTPAASRERLAGSMLRSLVRRLYDGAAGRAIAHLLESGEQVSPEELERLEKLIQARKESGK